MNIVKVYVYRPLPLDKNDTRRLIVLEDDVGWYYIKRLVEFEGFRTPFASIEEIELVVETKLELIKVIDNQP